MAAINVLQQNYVLDAMIIFFLIMLNAKLAQIFKKIAKYAKIKLIVKPALKVSILILIEYALFAHP